VKVHPGVSLAVVLGILAIGAIASVLRVRRAKPAAPPPGATERA